MQVRELGRAYETLKAASVATAGSEEVADLRIRLGEALTSVGILSSENQSLDQQFNALMAHFRSCADDLERASATVASLWRSLRALGAEKDQEMRNLQQESHLLTNLLTYLLTYLLAYLLTYLTCSRRVTSSREPQPALTCLE